MNIRVLNFACAWLLCTIGATTVRAEEYTYEKADPPRELTPEQAEVAAANYQKYCAICHGKDREGYANDHAPSLRSKQLLAAGTPHAVLRPMSYGRAGTAMGGYLDEVGGPMTLDETWDLTYWLFWQAGVDRVELSTKPVRGDATNGEKLYQAHCTQCHGVDGEGVDAPALGNQDALAHNSDEFLRYTIRHGREGTPMAAYQDQFSAQQIDDLTAFLRSRSSGWASSATVSRQLPKPENYVINPQGDEPQFTLKDEQYVMAEELFAALQKKQRMVLLDTRVPSVWQQAHIAGSFPLPYYADLDVLEKALPKDVQIVAYCSCPRAVSDYLVGKLRERGYTKTAVMWEGIFGWMHLGYPVVRADVEQLESDEPQH